MADSDLLHHYKVLKQFLDILDDTSARAKSNLSRAARAREKLLKLSAAQFKELSTDVYDELKRRIDESRSEPLFLLPKLTFHPKRNQARQKLSLLPQLRFKDLVLDISYEIERRQLHVPQAAQSPPQHATPQSHTRSALAASHARTPSHLHLVSPEAYRTLDHNNSVYMPPQESQHDASPAHESFDHDTTRESAHEDPADLATPDLRELVPSQTIGVQNATVVPTKANLAWLSDEEDDEKPRRLSLTNGFARDLAPQNDLRDNHAAAQRENANLAAALAAVKEQLAAAEQSHAQLEASHAALKADHAAAVSDRDLHQSSAGQLETEKSDLERALDGLRAEKDQLQAATAELEREKAVLQDSIAALQRDSEARSAEAPSAADLVLLQKEIESLKAAGAALRLENQALKNSQLREQKTLSRDFSSHTNSLLDASRSKRASVDVNSELKKLYEKMDTIGSPKAQAPAHNKEELLRIEIAQWQKRYEAVQSEKFVSVLKSPYGAPDLTKYVSSSGAIPAKTAGKFFSLIESFFLSLSDADADADLLFDKISAIAVSASRLSSYGDSGKLHETGFSSSIRDAASHALTSTRYYVSHSKFVPKVVVERAVAEVAFMVTDFVAAAKLNDGVFSDSPESRNLKISPLNKKLEPLGDDVRPLKIASKRLAEASPQSAHNKSVIADTLVISESDQSLPLNTKTVDAKLDNAQPKAKSLFEKLLNTAITKSKQDTNQEPPITKKDLKSANTSQIEPSKDTSFTNDTSFKKDISSNEISQDAPRGTKSSKTNILERVKHFESPPQESKFKKSPHAISPGQSVQAAKTLFSAEAGNEDEVIPSADSRDTSLAEFPKANKTNDGTPTRSKSIFQSLRDRFTSDATTKPTDEKTKLSDKSIDTSQILEAANKSVDTSAILNGSVHKQSLEEARPVIDDTDLNEIPVVPARPTKSRIANKELVEEAELGPAMKFDTSNATSGLDVKPKDTQNDEVVLPKKSLEFNEPALNVKEKSTNGTQLHTSRNGPLNGEETVSSISMKRVEAGSPLLKRVETRSTEGDRIPQSPEREITSAAEPARLSKESEVRSKSLKGLPIKSPSFKVRKVNYSEEAIKAEEEKAAKEAEDEHDEEDSRRQRQEYRKSMAAAKFNFDLFDIDDPDNTLTQVLLYLEHQTVQVISTIQDLLSAIKKPDATRGELRSNSMAISEVIRQMTEATNTSMNQTRNFQLKEHGSWVVRSLEDCNHRMNALCKPNAEKNDLEFADRHFKQRLAGISFDIAKCTKELVKTVEEASLKEDIAHLDARITQAEADDFT